MAHANGSDNVLSDDPATFARDVQRGASRVLDAAATLIGKDGSVVSLGGQAPAAVVPSGEYRLSAVTLALSDPAGGPRWTFVFSDQGRKGPPRWHAVPKDGTLTLDPVGKLDFRTGLGDAPGVKPGGELEFQPALYTADGLLIVTCVRGTPASPSGDLSFAEGVLGGNSGQVGAARCGFV